MSPGLQETTGQYLTLNWTGEQYLKKKKKEMFASFQKKIPSMLMFPI